MSRKACRDTLLVLAFIGGSLASHACVAIAADITWTGNAGDDLWHTPENWNNGAGPVPGPNDVARITAAGDYTVYVGPTPGPGQDSLHTTVGGLELGGASGTQTLRCYDPQAGLGALRDLMVLGPATVNANGRLILVGYQVGGQGALTVNGTILVHYLNRMLKDLITSAGSVVSIEAVDAGGSGPAELLVANGFTNLGTIALTSLVTTSGRHATLSITSGTLVNAAGATIEATGAFGALVGVRILKAELDNQGTLTIDAPLDIVPDYQVDHVNSGVINMGGGGLQVLQKTGTISSFTNTGTITVSAGRTVRMHGGTVNQNGGSISGAGTLSLDAMSAFWNTPFQVDSLYMTSSGLTLSSDLSTASTELEMWNGSALAGPVTVTNAPGHTVTVYNACTIGTAFVNQGALRMINSNITGAFSNAAGALLRVEGSGVVAIADGFTNLGAIELGLANQSLSTSLNVTNGTLVNQVGATITSQATAGGEHVLQTEFDNRGTISVGAKLTMGRNGATNANSGTIAVSGGDLRIILNSGLLTNSGAIPVSAGRTLVIHQGGLIQNGGSVSGEGTLWLEYAGMQFDAPVNIAALRLDPFGTAILSSDLSTANTSLTLVHSTLTGPVTVTNAAGKTMTCQGMCNINTALVNQGTLIAAGAINGALTTAVGSVLRTAESEALTIANGFTNLGTIEILHSAQFILPNGTLVNSAGATLKTADIDGAMTSLVAKLDNQGTMTVNSKLTLDKPAASHVNGGSINVSGADFTSRQWAGGSFTNSGTITVSADRTYHSNEGTFTNAPTGQLLGAGTYDFGTTFTNQGIIAPGASPGNLTLTGDATFSGGTLDIELGGLTVGTQYDRLTVSGGAALDGTLRVSLLSGFCASPGDTFQVLVAGSRAGTFDAIEILGTGNPVFNAQYGATGLTLVAQSNNLTVSASAGPGGSIAPNGAVSAACDSDPIFTITPQAGFEVADVLVDGISVGALTNYTFSDISEDHTIAVSFVDIAPPAVHVVTPNGGEVTVAFHATKIRWTALDNVAVDSVHVEYSLDGEVGPWTTILRSGTPTDSVDWTPPNECSDNALIRITSKDPSHHAGTDVSDAVFRVVCGALDAGAGRLALALHVPNPVGPGPVHMRISLPSVGAATVDIIAVTGQKVWSSRLRGTDGTQEVIWDRRGAEPGVYFARLVTAQGSRKVRFVVLR